MRVYLPRSVVFPYGYRVAVRVVTPAQLGVVAGQDGSRLKGCWREDKRTIYINKAQTGPEKVSTFWHEYEHAKVDGQNWAMNAMGLETKRIGACRRCGEEG